MAKSQFGRENPDSIDTPESAEYASPADFETVQERGFWGTPVSDEDKHEYTLEAAAARQPGFTPGVETNGLQVSSKEEAATRSTRRSSSSASDKGSAKAAGRHTEKEA
jgi:hypothetical protein